MMFLYLCDRVAYATGKITTAICGTETQEFLLPATAMTSTTLNAAWLEGQGIAIPVIMTSQQAVKEGAGNPLPIENDNPTQPGGWVDQSEEKTLKTSSAARAAHSSFLPLNAKIFLFLALLWLFNLMWPDS
jgi:hypothetical protein